MSTTSHIDTFANDRLPPASAQPEFLFELPELQFPPRLNCATELLDRHVAEGRGERVCLRAPGGVAWTYRELQAQANRIANVLVARHGARAGQPRAAARGQQADARRLLVRGDEGGRHRGGDDAAAARQGAVADHRQGARSAWRFATRAARRARSARRRRCRCCAARRVFRRRLAAGARGADGAPAGRLRQRRHRRRRHLPARLHLGHDRPAEGDDALPSRRDGVVRLLAAARAARRRRRRLHRQPAARLHLRARRAAAVPDAHRRLDGAAREGRRPTSCSTRSRPSARRCCSPRRPRTARWPTPRGSAASRRRRAAACASASRPARRCRRRRARNGARRPASRSSTASARPR